MFGKRDAVRLDRCQMATRMRRFAAACVDIDPLTYGFAVGYRF
jgi:hypothetical protein